MFTTFMAHVRNRRQTESNLGEAFTFDGTLHTSHSTESPSSPRRSRRPTATSANTIDPPNRPFSPKLDSRGHSRVPSTSTSTSTPTSTSTVTITNPIRREPHGSFVYGGDGRKNPIGQDVKNLRSNSRRRRLYPPVEEETAMSTHSGNERRTVAEFTVMPFERPQSRAEHRPGEALEFGPPPEVVRLDSNETGEDDSGPEIEIQNAGDGSGLVRI